MEGLFSKLKTLPETANRVRSDETLFLYCTENVMLKQNEMLDQNWRQSICSSKSGNLIEIKYILCSCLP